MVCGLKRCLRRLSPCPSKRPRTAEEVRAALLQDDSEAARAVGAQSKWGAAPSAPRTSSASRAPLTPSAKWAGQPSSAGLPQASQPSATGLPQGGGFVFMCNKHTESECAKLRVVGSPPGQLSQMQRCIGPGTELFLVNFETMMLMGVFVAVGAPERDIVPGAFRGRFNAQVRVAPAATPLRAVRLEGRKGGGPIVGVELAQLKQRLAQQGQDVDVAQEAWGPAHRGAGRAEDGAQHGALAPKPKWGPSTGEPRSTENGFVVVCSGSTQREAVSLGVLGATMASMDQMAQHITPNTPLFLYNVETQRVLGPFHASAPPSCNIAPAAFGGKLAAQVRVRVAQQPLRELQLEGAVPGGPLPADEAQGLVAKLRLGLVSVNRPQGPPQQRAPPAPQPQRLPVSRSMAIEKPLEEEQLPALDREGRRYDLKKVVVNFSNVGTTFAEKVLKRQVPEGERNFDWEGVRRCVRYLRDEWGMQVVGVVYQDFSGSESGGRWVRGVPEDIRRMCHSISETPRIDNHNHQHAQTEMAIKCAYRRNCRFMDNDNERDWLRNMRNEKCRLWLENTQELMQMRYYYDTDLGTFDTLDGNVPPGLLSLKVPGARSAAGGRAPGR